MASGIFSGTIIGLVWKLCFASAANSNIGNVKGFWIFFMMYLVTICVLGSLHIRVWKTEDKSVAVVKPKKATLKALVNPGFLSILFMYTIFKAGDKTFTTMFGDLTKAFPKAVKDIPAKSDLLIVMFSVSAGVRIISGIFMSKVGLLTWVYMIFSMGLAAVADTMLAIPLTLIMTQYYIAGILH
eukprot:264183_1